MDTSCNAPSESQQQFGHNCCPTLRTVLPENQNPINNANILQEELPHTTAHTTRISQLQPDFDWQNLTWAAVP